MLWKKKKKIAQSLIEVRRRTLGVVTEKMFRTMNMSDATTGQSTLEPKHFPIVIGFVVQLVEKNKDVFTTSELKKEVAVETCVRIVNNLYSKFTKDIRDTLIQTIDLTIELMIDTSRKQIFLNLTGRDFRRFRYTELENAQAEINSGDVTPY